METRICNTCEREYTPSSNHKDCPICRGVARKVLCDGCGGQKSQSRYTLCVKCDGKLRDGELNPNWRGGKPEHRKGYPMTKAPEHPRAHPNGYVLEHIIVMENKIGRHLLDGENVHHINGVRDDNRPENLELWTRPQPSGIRARDAVSWAKEILDRYGTIV